MIPFSCLWLGDPGAERRFEAACARRLFRPFDLVARGVAAAALLTALLSGWLGPAASNWRTTALAAASALTEILWMALNADSNVQARTALTAIRRATISLALLTSDSPQLEASPEAYAFALWLAIASGLGSLIIPGMIAPMLTKHQLPAAVAQAGVLLALRLPEASCAQAAGTAEGAALSTWAWRWLDSLFTGGVGGRQEPRAVDACRQVVVVTYAVVGVWVPCYAAWVREYNARSEFVGAGPAARRKLTWRLMCAHGVVGAVAVACLWLLLYPV
eukprot:evm.model.scf_1566.4 EVM.evm.TU.scf_1566.4   scf_1566:29861-30685(-)